MTLPRRSIRLREIHHLSQSQAALKLGIARCTLSRIERGLCSDLSWKILFKFCHCYAASPDYFLGFDHVFPATGRCSRCGGAAKDEPHSITDCIMEMHQQGRLAAYIAKEFDFTLVSVDAIISEEYRVKRERRISS